MTQKKGTATAIRDWGARRGAVRRIFPDRRNTVRLKQDRRRLFGRRKEDREKLASIERQLNRITSYNVCYTKLLRDREIHWFHPDVNKEDVKQAVKKFLTVG